MPSKKKDSAKKKAPPVAAAATGSEPDWKEIAITLWHDVNFAAANLKATGSGILYNPTTGTSRHWKERFADSLELMPGVVVDREAMHAMDLPKKQRLKFFKDREDAKKLSAQNSKLSQPDVV